MARRGNGIREVCPCQGPGPHTGLPGACAGPTPAGEASGGLSQSLVAGTELSESETPPQSRHTGPGEILTDLRPLWPDPWEMT
jgi:hypothetical protein